MGRSGAVDDAVAETAPALRRASGRHHRRAGPVDWGGIGAEEREKRSGMTASRTRHVSVGTPREISMTSMGGKGQQFPVSTQRPCEVHGLAAHDGHPRRHEDSAVVTRRLYPARAVKGNALALGKAFKADQRAYELKVW